MSIIFISQIEADENSTFYNIFGMTMEYEQEFEESFFVGKEEILEILESEEYLIRNDDSKPLKPKGKGTYEADKSYPAGRFVNNLGGEFQSLVETSTTWVASEWISTISVPQTYELRAYSKNEKMLKDGILYKSKDTTSETFIITEWDTI